MVGVYIFKLLGLENSNRQSERPTNEMIFKGVWWGSPVCSFWTLETVKRRVAAFLVREFSLHSQLADSRKVGYLF